MEGLTKEEIREGLKNESISMLNLVKEEIEAEIQRRLTGCIVKI